MTELKELKLNTNMQTVATFPQARMNQGIET